MLLRDLGAFEYAWRLGVWIIGQARNLGDISQLAAWLERQAVVARGLGRHEVGLALLYELESLCNNDPVALGRCLGNQAVLLAELGHYAEALSLHGREQQSHRVAGNLHGAALSLLNQGILQRKAGNTNKALPLFAEAERNFRRVGDWHAQCRALGSLADCHLEAGRPKKALHFSIQQERLCQETQDDESLSVCLAARINILMALEDYDAADTVLNKLDRRITQKAGRTNLQAQAGALRATLLWNTGCRDKARHAAQKALKLARQANNEELEKKIIQEIGVIFKNN